MLYLIKKFILQYLFFLRFNKSRSFNFVFFSKNFLSLRNQRPFITFDFSNNQIFHLGDMLFFEPSINLLSKYFKVEICIKNNFMKSYLKKLNYNTVIKINTKSNYIVSYLSLLMMQKKLSKKVNYIGIDVNRANQYKNLNDQLFLFFKKKFSLNEKKAFKPQKIKKIYSSHNYKFKYIILNAEIFSAKYMVLFKNFNKLFKEELKRLHKKYKIIQIGKNKNNLFKEFVYLNLSNKATFEDIIFLVKSKYCVGTLSFDNFIMHLSCIFNKKLIMVIERGRILNSEKIRKMLIPFFYRKYLNKSIQIIK